MKRVGRDLEKHIFGNPHSHSPSSVLSTQRVEQARSEALAFFQADPAHFDLIFVANATAAVKLVAEGLVDYAAHMNKKVWYGYHAAAHTSLVGVRELVAGGSRCFRDDQEVEDWFSEGNSKCTGRGDVVNLFAYPAQSNMNGRRLPLSWTGRIRNAANESGGETFTLLDAAALLTTAPLDLSDHANAPDFIALSFYKIFGFPDLGALLVRRRSGHVLTQRRYFGGGTVDMVINGHLEENYWHALKQEILHEALEDGTPPFHSIIALSHSIDVHRRIYKSMFDVSSHTSRLVALLFNELSSLRYANGAQLCEIYKDARSTYGDPKTQGPTIALNVRTPDGKFVGKSSVERLAIEQGIHLRTGGVCNPGGIAAALHLSSQELRDNFEEGLRCGNGIDELNGKPTGIIRISLGAMSSIEDVKRTVKFFADFTGSGHTRSMSLRVIKSWLTTRRIEQQKEAT